MIRKIQERDIALILEKAPLFWSEIKGENLLGELSLAGFRFFLQNSFRKGSIVGWIYEKDGFPCGGILFEQSYHFFIDKKCLSEIFWWMSPEHRNTTYSYKLIKEAEKFARRNQIDFVMMACMENPRPERLGEFYKKIGYHSVQHQYFKKINLDSCD